MRAKRTHESCFSIQGNFHQSCPCYRLPPTEESAAIYLGVRLETFRSSSLLQYGRILRLLRSSWTPFDKRIVGLMHQAAQEPRVQARPLLNSAIDEAIQRQQDWKDRVVLRLA